MLYDDATTRGWHVFPLKPASKTPAVNAWETWATTEPDAIWWSAADQGYGIACGPSNLYVIDLDVHQLETNGVKTWLELLNRHNQPWPDTYEAETPNGLHLYFQQTNQLGNTAGKLGPGIDTRGQGGYVVGYPHTNDHEPVPLPSWIADLLATRPKPPAPARPNITPVTTPFGKAALVDETNKIRNAPTGTRNSQLNESAFKIAQLVAGGEITERDAAEQLIYAGIAAGLGEHETVNTISSAFKAGANTPRSSRR